MAERKCPRCGLQMTQLSFKLWQCKCGYKETGAKTTEENIEDEQKRRRRLGGDRDRRFREQQQSAQKGLRYE